MIRVGGIDAGTYLYTRDHLSSVREVMKLDGTLQARYDYDAYGRSMTITQNPNYLGGCDFGFTGHFTRTALVEGQTELMLTHFRAYDPELGRWLSEDPLGIEGGINIHRYANNNPVNKWDEFGLKVSAVLDAKTGKLTVTDNDTGESITVAVITDGKSCPKTGTHTPSGKNENQREGPLPKGDYFIAQLPASHPRFDEWFALYADDGFQGNDKDQTMWGKRDGFRLHYGSFSDGCATVTQYHDSDKKNWNRLHRIILNTKSWRAGPRGGVTYKVYGTLTVK